MKHLGKIGLGIVLIGICTTLLGSFLDIMIVFLGLLFGFIGIGLLAYWRKELFVWECEHCEAELKVPFKQNIADVNHGVNQKEAICPECNKQSTFIRKRQG